MTGMSAAVSISVQDKEDKRRNVVAEIFDTEKSYVAGLDLIYEVRSSSSYSLLLTPTNPISIRHA